MEPKLVPGFENLYLSLSGTPYQKVDKDFVELKVSSSSVYDRVSVLKDGKKERCHVHVLMALTFLDLDPALHGTGSDSLQVDHKDGNKRNNSLENLEVVTKRENYERALKAGCYSKNGYASKGRPKKTLRKFSEDDIAQIKEMRSAGFSYRKIAAHFSCNHLAVYQILKGKTYQDLS
jgi:HNH endonuclease